MYIYSYNKEIPKISLGSIKFLTSQLEGFISLYEKKVLITSQEQRDKLDQLKRILVLLQTGQYNQLMTNPYMIIDFMDDNEEYLPKYYPT